jgi:hypothetical protein
MATGPEHYRDAEKAIEFAWSGESSDPELGIATAQVHATLALAAVQVDMAENLRGMGKKWAEVTR